MDVYVCGYRGKGFGGHAIRWFSAGDYCHVSLVFDFGSNKPVEIESIQGVGVHKQTFNAKDTTYDLFKVDCTKDQAYAIYEVAGQLLGSKYDWSGLWSFVRRRKRENPNKWFCSELVAYCLLKAGIQLLRLPPWKQTPVLVCASTVIPKCNTPKYWRM